MAHYFCDSSAIVKRYVAETGTGWVIALTSPAIGNTVYLARITGVEVVSAITRRLRRGALIPTDAQQAIYNFRADLPNDFAFVEVTPLLTASAMNLAERHGLRGYDAVQLAAALQIQQGRLTANLSNVTFLSADAALNAAAQAEGLAVDNPNAHP